MYSSVLVLMYDLEQFCVSGDTSVFPQGVTIACAFGACHMILSSEYMPVSVCSDLDVLPAVSMDAKYMCDFQLGHKSVCSLSQTEKSDSNFRGISYPSVHGAFAQPRTRPSGRGYPSTRSFNVIHIFDLLLQ